MRLAPPSERRRRVRQYALCAAALAGSLLAASGAYDIGFGDVNSLVRFRDENPATDLKAVMVLYDRPPFAIIGRKSRGITGDLASLRAKSFGAPAGDAAFAQWPIFKT